jgi:hypothetical protein
VSRPLTLRCPAAQTYKFSIRVQLESISSNELGDPDDLIDCGRLTRFGPVLRDWRDNNNLKLLNLVRPRADRCPCMRSACSAAVAAAATAADWARCRLSDSSVACIAQPRCALLSAACTRAHAILAPPLSLSAPAGVRRYAVPLHLARHHRGAPSRAHAPALRFADGRARAQTGRSGSSPPPQCPWCCVSTTRRTWNEQ